MKLRHLILTAALILASGLPLAAQDQDLRNSLELFENRLYFLAHEKLMKLADESSQPDTVEQAYYYAAQCSFFLRQYKNAISEFTSLLINFPNSPFSKNAKYRMALSYHHLKNYTYAIKSLKNYIEEFPEEKTNPGIRLLMAESYLYLEYYDTALPLLEEVRSQKDLDGKTRSRASFFTGLVYFYQGDYTPALKIFREITSPANDRELVPYALFYSGVIHFGLKNREEAERLFTLILESGTDRTFLVSLARFYLYLLNRDEKTLRPLYAAPQEPPLAHWLNILLVRSSLSEKKDEELLEALETGLRSSADRDIYYRYLYLYYLKKKDFEKGEIYLKNLLDEYPLSPFAREARYNLGLLFLKNGDYDAAEGFFREVSAGENEQALSLRLSFYQGEIRLAVKDYPGAESFFLDCLKTGGGNSPFFLPSVRRLSDLYLLQEEHKKNLELLLPLKIRDRELMYNLAASYAALRQLKEALELLTDILDHDPLPELEHKAYLLLHAAAGEQKDEKFIAGRIFKMRNNKLFSPEVFTGLVVDLARLYFLKNNYKESVNILLQIVGPDLPASERITVNRLLYENYRELKEWEKARLILDSLIKLDPGNGEYIEERERIKDL